MAQVQVINVDPAEEINGLVRVLRLSAAHVVVFRVPDGARVFRNGVNLRLLRFYADQEGKELRISTSDAVVLRLAREAQILLVQPESDVAPETVACGEQETRTGGPLSAGAGSGAGDGATSSRETGASGGLNAALATALRPRWRHLWAVPALFGLIAAVYLFWGPAVTLSVTPAVSERSLSVALQGESRQPEPRGLGEVFLERTVRNLNVEGVAPATGRRRTGLTKAAGRATFLNQSKGSVTLSNGQILATPGGVRFRLVQSVRVPGVRTDYFMKIAVGMRAGQAEGKIEALAAGSDGNVAAGRVTVIEGKAGSLLKATNPEPLRGGEDRVVAVVTADDLSRAEEALQARAAELAKKVAAVAAPTGSEPIDASLRWKMGEVQFDQSADSEAATVRARCELQVTALNLRRSGAEQAARAVFTARLPANLMQVGTSLEVGPVAFGRVEGGGAELFVPVHGRVARRLSAVRVRELVRGRSVAEARARLLGEPGVAGVRIEGAQSRLPDWAGRIRVRLLPPGRS